MKTKLILILFLLVFTYNQSFAWDWNFLCKWNCGIGTWTQGDYLCQNMDKFIDYFNSDHKSCYWDIGWTFYCDKEGKYRVSPMVWNDINIYFWWTWYVAWLKDYCIANNYWTDVSSEIPAYTVWSYTFTMKASDYWTYSWQLLWKKNNDYISIKWSQNVTTKTLTTPTFNSPFIYFKNQPVWNIKVSINSEWNEYTSTKPEFNIKNWWNLNSDWKNVSIDWKKTDNLFYELAVKKIELSRNWKNFSSKKELVDFLKTWDFFDKLWFSKEQKENSLNYILPKVKDSKNYYLTILDNESINNISKLDINPTPENLVRKYFAIYPTNLPIKTNWNLIYPNLNSNIWYTVEENWEFYIDDNMFVLWK